MTTRLSKIARLPANIREELNRRLHDGELSRTILPWVNNLAQTKKVLRELFAGKPITHQNLSEWRRAGYQDWLFHQQRLDWFSHLTEQSTEIQQHDGCPDTFETMANIFLFEIGQALTLMKTTKDPNQRCDRLQNLIREFARLQNAYNWSRRVELDFAKHNATLQPEEEPEIPEKKHPASKSIEAPSSARISASQETGGASVPASRAQTETDADEFIKVGIDSERTAPERQAAGALQDAPRISEASTPRASVPDCGSPLPLSDSNSQTLSSARRSEAKAAQTPPSSQPIPPLAPTTPTPNLDLRTSNPQTPAPNRNLKGVHVPMRGRRFVCIEG